MGRIVCNEIDYSGSPLVTDSTPNASSVNPVTSAGVYNALVGQEELLRDTVGFTSKNLIPFPYRDGAVKTNAGITYTVRPDGSIKANGTATGLSQYFFDTLPECKLNFLAGQEVIVSGGHSNNKRLEYWVKDVVTIGSTGDEAKGTMVNLENVSEYNFGIKINIGETCNNEIFYPMIRKADIMDSTYEQYRKPVSQYIKDKIKDTVGWSNKNLIPFPYKDGQSVTRNGVTYTVDSNGVITANGTATGTSHFELASNLYLSPNIVFTLNGDYDSDVSEDTSILFNYDLNGEEKSVWNRGATDIPIFNTSTYDNNKIRNLRVRIGSGVTVSNFKFYPMIFKADDLSPAYESYNPSVKQVLRNNKIIEGKNLIPFPYKDGYSVTKLGITFTVNSDGSVKVTGSYTGTGSGAYFDLTDFIYQFVPEGTYILTDGIGARPTDADSSWYIYATKKKGASGTENYQPVDKTTGKAIITVNYSQHDYLRISLFIQKYANLGSGVTFYPMFCKATETDPTYEPYYIPGVVSQEAQNILGAKNLLKNTRITTGTTKNGVTVTVNSDGSLTFNGTASADSYWNFNYVGNTNSEGSYDITPLIGRRLKASISKVKHNSLRLHNGYFTANDASYVDTINEIVYTESEFVYPTQAVRAKDFIEIKSGGVFNNFTIYPMIRLAEIQDDTYTPYVKTNRELTELNTVKHYNVTSLVQTALQTADNTITVQAACINVYGKIAVFDARVNRTNKVYDLNDIDLKDTFAVAGISSIFGINGVNVHDGRIGGTGSLNDNLMLAIRLGANEWEYFDINCTVMAKW